nr:uncharacterized protein LOC127315550 [Lolium perenne]
MPRLHRFPVRRCLRRFSLACSLTEQESRRRRVAAIPVLFLHSQRGEEVEQGPFSLLIAKVARLLHRDLEQRGSLRPAGKQNGDTIASDAKAAPPLNLPLQSTSAYSELSTRCTGDRRRDCFAVGLVVWHRRSSDISVCYRPFSFCGYGLCRFIMFVPVVEMHQENAPLDLGLSSVTKSI